MFEQILVYLVLGFVALMLVTWLYRFATGKTDGNGCGGFCGSCNCGHSNKADDKNEPKV